MGVADRALSLALAGAFVLGCASDGGPDFDTTRATQAKTEIEQAKQDAEAEPAPKPVDTAPPVPAEPAVDPTQPVTPKPGVVQFEAARVDEEPEAAPPTLFEAAEAERQRRAQSAPSRVVITDANLGEYGAEGQLSEFSSELSTDEGAGTDARIPSAEEADPEAYWRQRVRDARLAWRAAADRISELEGRVAELRYEFYSEDDAYHRDAVTKPAWDRAAIDLEQARLRVEEVRLQLDRVLEEGYAAAALPGWLREGIEFEPEDTADRKRTSGDLETATAIEPPIAEEPPR